MLAQFTVQEDEETATLSLYKQKSHAHRTYYVLTYVHKIMPAVNIIKAEGKLHMYVKGHTNSFLSPTCKEFVVLYPNSSDLTTNTYNEMVFPVIGHILHFCKLFTLISFEKEIVWF